MAYTTIDDPTIYFNTLLWSGDDTASRNLTGVGFQPDWIWGKARSRIGNHWAIDSVRGTTGSLYRVLNPDAADVEQTTNNDGTTAYGIVTTIGSDGFTIADGNQGDLNVNNSGDTYVAWNWKAGTSFSNDASSTGVGTIDSTGSISTLAGFSIISYTGNGTVGATIAHGLGVIPNVVLVKGRSIGDSWTMLHSGIASDFETDMVKLDEAVVKIDSNVFWNDTKPTSSVFTVDGSGGETKVNDSGKTYIAYCFRNVQGYSKFSSYTGNGNADGPFIHLGFRPAWVIVKNVSQSGSKHWGIHDNKRDTGNPSLLQIDADDSYAEFSSTNRAIDFLSNGFKIRSADSDHNTSGETFVYWAFAESPFVNSNGVPNNAR